MLPGQADGTAVAQKAFKEFDRNRDGSLVASEFHKAIGALELTQNGASSSADGINKSYYLRPTVFDRTLFPSYARNDQPADVIAELGVPLETLASWDKTDTHSCPASNWSKCCVSSSRWVRSTTWAERQSPPPFRLLCPPSLDRRIGEFSCLCHGSRLGTPPGFCSKTGGLLPMAPCCSSSNFSCAPASVRNQWAFRHSARKRPLNASMNALSVGLPGCEKSRTTLFW